MVVGKVVVLVMVMEMMMVMMMIMLVELLVQCRRWFWMSGDCDRCGDGGSC